MNVNSEFYVFYNLRFSLLILLMSIMPFTLIAQENVALVDSVSMNYTPEDLPSMAETFSNETPVRILRKRNTYAGGWFFIVNVFLLILLLIKFMVFGEYSKKSWNAWVNQNLFFQFIREKQPLNVILFIIELVLKIYFLSLLLIFLLYAITGNWELNLKDFLYVYIGLLTFFIVKSLCLLFLSMLTEQWSQFKILTLMNVVFTSNFSWFLVPIILLAVYLDFNLREYMVFALLGMALIGLFVYIFRGVGVLRKIGMPLNVHFFIYLCAFEIVPYLILFKVMYNFKLVS